MKGKKLLFVTAVFALFLFTPICASASDLRLPDSAWDVNYTVEVSAPDGGVNFRWGPGVEYGKIQESMIPNGTLLPIFKEATAQNGNNWGLTDYNDTSGWIALTQVSVVEIQESMIPNGTLLPIFKEATAQNGNNWGLTDYNDTSGWIALTQVSVVADSTSEPEKGIVFKHFMENGMEYATVTSYDKEGKTLWTYKTDSYEGAQCNRVSEIGQQNGYFYLVEDGAVAALDELTGEIVWKNEEFIGAGTEKGYVFDKNGTLYISGYLGPDLFIVDKNGKTLYRKDSFEKGYWPYEMELKDENILRIHVAALDELTGEIVWKNEEFIGAGTEKGYVFDKNGTLYISGYLGPDLFIVDKNGKTLYRKDSFGKGYWPYEMELKDENILRIHFESDMEGKGTQPWMEIRLEELYRKDSFGKGYWPYEMELKDENILRIHFESDMEGKGTQPWMEIRLEESVIIY